MYYICLPLYYYHVFRYFVSAPLKRVTWSRGAKLMLFVTIIIIMF